MRYIIVLLCCAWLSGQEPILPLNEDRLVMPGLKALDTIPGSTPSSDLAVDPALPPYRPQNRAHGRIVSIGSDTLNNCMTLWAEELRKFHPIDICLRGKGSATTFPPLIAEISHIGPMSRLPKQKEIDAFYDAFPKRYLVVMPVALDAVVVAVHRSNPLTQLHLDQVASMFAMPRDSKDTLRPLTKWAQVGWAQGGLINPIGRNSASGMYGFSKNMRSRNDTIAMTYANNLAAPLPMPLATTLPQSATLASDMLFQAPRC